jgi:hypothetical protein
MTLSPGLRVTQAEYTANLLFYHKAGGQVNDMPKIRNIQKKLLPHYPKNSTIPAIQL